MWESMGDGGDALRAWGRRCEERSPSTGREVRNTKIGPCATRALPRLGDMALKVMKMGTYHLARANGAIDGPYCALANLAQCVCVWKAEVCVGVGAGAGFIKKNVFTSELVAGSW
jgi:hypothetical protein